MCVLGGGVSTRDIYHTFDCFKETIYDFHIYIMMDMHLSRESVFEVFETRTLWVYGTDLLCIIQSTDEV
jgi:hypothetical protein